MNNVWKKDKDLFVEKNPRKNASGCNDPTAYEALNNIEKTVDLEALIADADERLTTAMELLRHVLWENDCVLVGRITIADLGTGREYNYMESPATKHRRCGKGEE